MSDDDVDANRWTFERFGLWFPTTSFGVATVAFLVAAALDGLGRGRGQLALAFAGVALVLAIGWWLAWPRIVAKGVERRSRRSGRPR